MPSHLGYRLLFDACCPELLRKNLPCSVFHQFLLVFLKRCVLYNTLHHTIDGVFAEPLLLVPNIFGGVFNYGEVKRTLVSQLLGCLRIYCSSNSLEIFSRTRHFVEMFVLVFFKFCFFFSLIRPCLPDIQPVCADFKVFLFFAFSLSCSTMFWFGGKSAIQI